MQTTNKKDTTSTEGQKHINKFGTIRFNARVIKFPSIKNKSTSYPIWMKSSPTYHPCMIHLPIYIWLFLVHVGKYTIHGLFGSKSLPSRCHLKSYSRWCFCCWCTPNSFPSRGFPRKSPSVVDFFGGGAGTWEMLTSPKSTCDRHGRSWQYPKRSQKFPTPKDPKCP